MLLGYFLKVKLRTILYSCAILSSIILLIYYYKGYNYKLYLYKVRSSKQPEDKVILWWTPFIKDSSSRTIKCKINNCIVTENREYLNKPETSVVLFYGSTFNVHDLPLPRNPTKYWALIHEESPKNLALYLGEDAWSIFNITSTFSRYSDFPITLQHLPNIKGLLDKRYFIPIKEKNKLLASKKLAPILYIQSDCTTPLERDSYVTELMKYIPVDSYGGCINNKELPDELKENRLINLYSDDFLRFVAQYKFVIAFENAVCHDYITEKLWRPLISGSIPIYLGSPTIKDWLPNNNSAIIVDEYKTLKDLVKHIQEINNNDELYNTYLDHKISGVISNKLLINNMKTREWSIHDGLLNTSGEEVHFFPAFECYLCDTNFKEISTSNKRDVYNCPELISPLSKRKNKTNWWNDYWREGKCQAKLLKQLIEDTRIDEITEDMFQVKVQRLINVGVC